MVKASDKKDASSGASPEENKKAIDKIFGILRKQDDHGNVTGENKGKRLKDIIKPSNGFGRIATLLAMATIIVLTLSLPVISAVITRDFTAPDRWSILNDNDAVMVRITEGGLLEVTNNVTVHGSMTVSGSVTSVSTIDGVPSSGTAVGTTTVAVESYGQLVKTVLTLTDLSIVVTNQLGDTNGAGGVKIYDWPEGNIYVQGFEVNDFNMETNVVVPAYSGAWFSFGTAIGTSSNLTGTMIDLTDAKVAQSPITNLTDAVTALDAISESRFDGTTTAKDIFCNLEISGTNIASVATNLVNGTVTIHWLNLGDN